MRKKCPNAEFLLVHIFPYLVQIYSQIFSPVYTSPGREQDEVDKISRYIKCVLYYYHLQFPHNWLPSYDKCLLSLPVFGSLLTYTYSPTETMPKEFKGPAESTFCGSEKDHYFSKIPKWQHKLVREYKRGKLVAIF